MIAFSLAASFSLILAVGTVHSMELPRAPEGYSWKEIAELKAAILVPSAWKFSSELSGNEYLYTVTREDKGAATSVASSLTLIARRELSGNYQQRLPPSQFAEVMFNEMRKNRELERTEKGEQGPFATFRYQYATAPEGKGGSREYSLLVANDKTGTLYIITFEASLEKWEEDWQTASVSLNTIFLDDEI